MRNQKVFNTNQVNWYDNGSTRLNYQMLFQEPEEQAEDHPESIDLEERLNERDEKWRNKLKIAEEKAYKEGYETGRAEGLETARNEIDAKIAVIKSALEDGQEVWQRRQNMIQPGLLDLAFDIAETILGIPVDHERIRPEMEDKLGPLLQKLDEEVKPVVQVHPQEMEFVDKLIEEYVPTLTINVKAEEHCKPGEFILDTENETVVHKFQDMLKEFKKELDAPTWNS